MAAPAISPLPAAPAASDAVADFEAKAFEFVDALSPFGTEANALADWMETTAGEVDDAKTAAEGAAATAAVDAAAAAAAAMAGVTAARDAALAAAAAAEDSEDLAALHAAESGASSASALAAAAAAGAAAGLPSLAGNNGAPLRVTRDGLGVAFSFGPAARRVTEPAEPGLPIVAVCGDLVDCRVSGIIITLPTSPADQDWVTVRPRGNSPTVDPGSATIEGVDDTVVLDISRPTTFLYTSDLNDWGIF